MSESLYTPYNLFLKALHDEDNDFFAYDEEECVSVARWPVKRSHWDRSDCRHKRIRDQEKTDLRQKVKKLTTNGVSGRI